MPIKMDWTATMNVDYDSRQFWGRKTFATEPGKALVNAQDVRPGETVVFEYWPNANYTVDEVDTDSLGRVRHHHGDWTGSSCYEQGELLWVLA